jgi:acyl transferase domain-containing protein
MLSVRLSEEQLALLLPKPSLAAVNSSVLCVVAGEDDKIKEFAQSLDDMQVANKLLVTSHAFHSDMMEPIVATLSKR